MSTEGLAALVRSQKSRVVAVEGAIYKAPEPDRLRAMGRNVNIFTLEPFGARRWIWIYPPLASDRSTESQVRSAGAGSGLAGKLMRRPVGCATSPLK